MTKDVRKQFEAIAREAVVKAEMVTCDISDFSEGLELIESHIHERREMT